MMEVLGTARNALFPRIYPYEMRIGAYLSTLLRHISEDCSKEEDPWAFEQEIEGGKLSKFPYDGFEDARRWRREVLFERIAKAASEAISDYPDDLPGKKDFWIEKFPHLHQEFFEIIFDKIYFINLIRDPIDIAISRYLMSINHDDFRRTTKDLILFFDDSITEIADLFDFASSNPESSRIHKILVRYEDLIRDLPKVVARIGLEINGLEMSVPTQNFNELAKVHSSKSYDSQHDNCRLRIIENITSDQKAVMNKLGY